MEKRYKSIKEFYLTEHLNKTCRFLHFVGTSILLIVLVWALITQTWLALWAIPVIGYGFAWVGLFFFKKNTPTAFQYPLYNLASDFIMFKDLLVGKQNFSPNKS